MKITRFNQSCILLEESGHKLLIDPGSYFTESHGLEGLEKVDAVLYTHEHPDHCDKQFATLLDKQGVTLIVNHSTAKLLEGIPCRIIEDMDKFTIANFDIEVRELPHCHTFTGEPGPQNTGYLINGKFFHPGDGVEIDDLQADILALPIAGPDISFADSFGLARSVGAKTVITIHDAYVHADAKQFAAFSRMLNMDFEVVVLKDGESIET